ELLRRCLAKDAQQRLRDAGDARLLLGGPLGHAPASRARRSPIVVTAFATLLLGALGAAWVLRERAGDSGPGPFRQLNLAPAPIFRAAFGPDGRTVVYSAARDGFRPEIFAVRPDSPEPQALGLADCQLLGASSQGELAILVRPRYVGHRLFDGTLARVPLE